MQKQGKPIFEGAESRSAEEAILLSLEAYTNETRHLHLRGALGAARTAQVDGQEYLIVPVVALMDGVIHAVNASTPERVTTATLAKAAASWNGRPLVLGHPMKNGRQCSANEPDIRSTHHFGMIFNSRMQGSKLCMDAYVDPVRAEKIGGADFVKKLRAGEQIEVSVGAYVQTRPEDGVYNGKPYKGTWLETHGDHLAFLPGGKGACSIEMGCGAHRAAQMHLVTAEEFKILGGPGSGNKGHAGRPGQVGGSASGGSGSGGGGGTPKGGLDSSKMFGGNPNQAADYKREMETQKAFESTDEALSATAKAQKNPSLESHRAAAIEHNKAAGAHQEAGRLHGYDTAEGEKAQLLAEIHSEAEWAHEIASGDPDYQDETSEHSIDELVADLKDSAAKSPHELSKVINVGGHASPSSGSKFTGTYLPEDAGKDDSVDPPPGGPWYLPGGKKPVVGKDYLPGSIMDKQAKRAKKKLKGASSRDCSVCDGTGQIKNEKKQEDCPSCGGAGKITAAEDNDGSAVMEDQIMKKVDAIKALTACPCSGFVPADAKELEAFSEERLTAMAEFAIAKKKTDDEVAVEKEEAAKKFKAAEDTIAELKAVSEKAPTEDEYLAKAPESIRTLVAEKKAQDVKIKTDLVAQLKVAAAGAYTEAELNEKSISELMKLATMAKVDYSGRSVPRAAADGSTTSTYTPPDPYAAGIKALQGKSAVN